MAAHPGHEQQLAGSFRDPSGFLFTKDGILFRQVNQAYREQYDLLMASGLYDKLVQAGLLVGHKEEEIDPADPAAVYRVIKPEVIPFVSYPYEWSFSQLKDAALTTLAIQKLAIARGMILKDASAYNIQFHQGKPLLIDTLSFDFYHEGETWVAYRQFCQHFLAPLALMVYTNVRLSQLLRIYIDGIPLDLAAKLLPMRTHYSFGLAAHLHMHAAAQKHYADKPADSKAPRKMGKLSMTGLIDSLESTTRNLSWKPTGTEWADYYVSSAGHYTPASIGHKKQVVGEFLQRIKPATAWDLGANTGEFSRLAAEMGACTLAFDIDPAAVEINYLKVKENGEGHLLPLVMDFTNPSPSLGWHNRERQSLLERAPADVVLALALIHHLAISNNVPLALLADYLNDLGTWLIIEWVPKDDPQAQKLLASRMDIFSEYHQEGFEAAFSGYFKIRDKIQLQDSPRVVYLMEKI